MSLGNQTMKRTILVILWVGMMVTVGEAQTLRSSYFLNSMPMRHKLNPALASDRGYISVPGLGNVMADVHSNLSLTSFLYPQNGGLTTFMNPSISASEFLSGIVAGNALKADVDVTLLSTGFYGKRGFTTIDISARSMSDLYLPGELFRFMKLGMDHAAGSRYHIENLTLQSDNYVEVAVGHAHPIGEKLVIGVKLKGLIGAANVRATIDRMDISLSGDQWLIDANGVADLSARGSSFRYDEQGRIQGLDWHSPGPAGWGLGVDLGMVYRFDDRWLLSASVVDLGFIRWSHNLRGETRNEPFSFEGFHEVAVGSGSQTVSLRDQWRSVREDLEALLNLYEGEAPQARTRMLRTTIHVGGEDAILDRKISFGLLSSTRLGMTRIWTEAMGSVNFRPARWFNVVVTAAASNYGTSWGWLLNFAPKGVNLFFGTDHMVTRFTSQYIPLGRASAVFNLGMNIPIGARRDDQMRRDPWRRGGVWRP